MRFSLAITLAAPAVLAASCNSDNCLKALKSASTANTRDCQSFLTKTVTPCPSSTTTVTTTTVVTTTIGSAAPKKRHEDSFEVRAVTSSACPTSTTGAPPKYAAACSGAVRYSSACSCLGVTATGVTTIPSPVATATFTRTSTSTVTAVCSTFQAKATSGTYAGQFLVDGVANPYSSIPALGFSPGAASGEPLQLIGDKIYAGNGDLSRPWRSFSGYAYVFDGPSDYNGAASQLTCSLSPISLNGTARITCMSHGQNPGTAFQTFKNSQALNIGPDVYDGEDGGEQAAGTGLDLVTVPKC